MCPSLEAFRIPCIHTDIYKWILKNMYKIALTSSTVDPTAQASGFPPKVLKCIALVILCAIFGDVTTAASGKPLPIPLAIVTKSNQNLRYIFGCSNSSGSSGRVRRGPRNMKSMRPPLAAIFFMTYFYRARGGIMAPLAPPWIRY